MSHRALPLAEVTRRDEASGQAHVESTHVGHVVVTLDGAPIVEHGDGDRPTFLRSAVKPVQATTCLEILEEHGWPGGEPGLAEVAVGWASHRAEDEHLAAVRRLCERAGIDEDALTCPPAQRPDGPATGGPVLARIHHNCSGKHALFALVGRALGVRGAALLDPKGPLQTRLLAELVAQFGALTGVAVDGCGAPAVEATLVGLARTFGELAVEPRFKRVREAGFAHPNLVGGRGLLESTLLATGTMAKHGAEGVYGAGWRSPLGIVGVAVKAEDGALRGAAAGLAAVVAASGRGMDGWEPEMPMGAGQPVGAVRAAPELVAALAGCADLG